MSDFDNSDNQINNEAAPEKKESLAQKPDFPSWFRVETATPARSRFNFSNNRLAPPPPAVAPTLISTPRRSKSPRPKLFGRGKELLNAERSPLVFNVAQLMRDVEGSTRDYPVQADQLMLSEADNQQARNISGRVRFTKVRHNVLAQGKFEADVDLNCVRCLEDFSSPIEIEIADEYEPSIDIATGLPARSDETEADADDKLKIDPNHMLDLGEALRQQFLVSLPMHPLCREDCPGLLEYVEKANADVPIENEEAPPTAQELVDQRWAALTKLLKED